MVPWFRRLIDAAAAALGTPSVTVECAVARFDARYDGGPAYSALLARKLTIGRHGRLVDGPLRLAVVADGNIISADPRTGELIGHRPVTDMTGYYADAQGRFLVGFQQPQGNFPAVAAVRPVELHGSPELSARAAGYLFVRRLIDVWEARTGTTFVNGWVSGQTQLESW